MKPEKPDLIRVLVVDDNADIVQSTVRLLERSGYATAKAANGVEALKTLQTFHPHLVLSDRDMPEMDGLEMCRRIKGDPSYADVFVVLLSGTYTQSEEQAAGLDAGADGYIGRPIANRELAARVEAYARILRLNRSMRETEQRQRALLNSINDAIISVDHAGNIVGWNPGAERVFGYAETEILSQPVTRLIPASHQKGHHDGMARVQAGGAHHVIGKTVEVAGVRKDGGEFPLELSLSEWTVAGANFYTAIIHDLTARKLAEAEREKLEAQNRQLQKSESLGRMAGAIAHNFNNHLAAVIMNLDLLQQAEAGPELSGALESAREAAKISGQMLVYLGQTHAQLEQLDLAATFRQSLPLLQVAMPKNMDLKTDLPVSGPIIKANAGQMQQVLTNLMTNAWEAFGKESGNVGLTVKLVPATEIPAAHRLPIGWQPSALNYACLEVADSGGGIAAGDLEKIFDPFFTSKFTGRGLGLPVVLGIVRKHGGAITVESEPGRGSSFRVFLPAMEAAVSRPASPVVAVPNPTGSTVLVVEDEPAVLNVVVRALQKYGHPVLAAKDGVEAVELFRQRQAEIGCVLCDVAMPRMDGWKTLAALHQIAPGIPVILCSGHDEANVMAGEHPDLPQAFLKKPYELQTLLTLLNRFLPPATAPAKSVK